MQRLCDTYATMVQSYATSIRTETKKRDEKMEEKNELKSKKTYRKMINMEEAYKRLNSGESVQAVANFYGIDRSTLYRRISDFKKKNHDEIEKYLKNKNGEIYSFTDETEKDYLIAYQKNLEMLTSALSFFDLKVENDDPYCLKIKSSSDTEISINFFDKASILDFRIWEKPIKI